MKAKPIETLGDSGLSYVRCSGCCDELAQSSPAEEYTTSASRWIVVTCQKCDHCTPFQLVLQ